MVQRLGTEVCGLIRHTQIFEDGKWSKGGRKEEPGETEKALNAVELYLTITFFGKVRLSNHHNQR
ncbi:hypothetical protein BM1_05328 [Bipolaris maydis]|nr:hypothetical protein BM1_05328 [Bipolaris maydis]